MSGGGGNFGSGSFTPSEKTVMTCDNLNIIVSIAMPDFNVFNTKELDSVEISMFVEDSALVFEYNNKLIGYGSDAYINKLIECLEQGYNYTAIISSFEWDSYIRVKIQ
ncbi:hypothetical protein [Acinetobacter ursingii]|uniref:hypothetical protein n=1 Tax=Acinetobacter ursingii TaxID=108980 RepID=UPI00125043DB|nr:hypothetical protein [Acinetobacter ursingii]MCU4359657.1 hypothetical protein [Acinetobacter ursingii]MCU4590120.1 hypothetical protein [Acinetobacter ursingii]